MIRAGDNVNSHSSTAFLQARLPAQGKKIAPSGVFVELPDWGTCFFRQHFSPGKPTLLLVHGMVCSSGLNGFRLFPALSPHFNVIAPDIRGHGRSGRGPGRFSFERAANDMASLLRELETGPIIAVGYSMGGAIIQHLWRQHRDQVAGLGVARRIEGRKERY